MHENELSGMQVVRPGTQNENKILSSKTTACRNVRLLQARDIQMYISIRQAKIRGFPHGMFLYSLHRLRTWCACGELNDISKSRGFAQLKLFFRPEFLFREILPQGPSIEGRTLSTPTFTKMAQTSSSAWTSRVGSSSSSQPKSRTSCAFPWEPSWCPSRCPSETVQGPIAGSEEQDFSINWVNYSHKLQWVLLQIRMRETSVLLSGVCTCKEKRVGCVMASRFATQQNIKKNVNQFKLEMRVWS